MRKHSRFARRALAVAALLTLTSGAAFPQAPAGPLSPATTRRPEGFGIDNYTVTVIPASSFTSDMSPTTDYGSTYRRFEPADSAGHLFAGAEVPAGAVIDFVGIQAHNDHHYPYQNYQVTLFSADQHSGTTTGQVSFIETYTDADSFYETTYNETPIGFAWTQNAHQMLVIDLYQIPFSPIDCAPTPFLDCREDFGVGWVEIWWKRSVSPAPETPSFADVPSSDGGYQYIEALKASGITGGCGGPNFCPEANLTRRQMAIFLAKALGLHWPM